MAEQRHLLIVHNERQVREVLHQIFVAAGCNCLLLGESPSASNPRTKLSNRMQNRAS